MDEVAMLTQEAGSAVRRKRWAPLMKGFEEDAKPMTAKLGQARRLEEKRRACERMLDMQLRAMRGVFNADAGEGPRTFDPEHTAGLFEHISDFALKVKTGRLEEAGETTIGWIAPGSIPSTDKIFTTQSFGMIRRVFPKLMMPDLISVQPMVQPTGKVFYRDVKYNSNYQTIASGERVDDISSWSVRDQEYYASTQNANTNPITPELTTARGIYMDISSKTVDAEAKKLSYSWSTESQQDFRAYHGIDAEATLDQDAADEIIREIDRLMVDFIYTTALSQGAGVVNWNKTPTSTLPTEVRSWNETLIDACEDASVYIQNKRYRRAQWILCNATTAARFRKMNGFVNTFGNDDTAGSIDMGARHIFGTVQNRFVIYVDPWFFDNVLVVGYKGDSMVDAGIAYCPYIPFYRTEKFEDPTNFKQTKGIMSRFGKVAMVPEMYAIVNITGS